MRCPKCWAEMDQVATLTRAQSCRFCRGVWLDKARIEALVVESGRLYNALRVGTNLATEHPCPACGDASPLCVVRIEHSSLELDWCHRCFGIFFDTKELEALQERVFRTDMRQLEHDQRVVEGGFGGGHVDLEAVGKILDVLAEGMD